jgi:hypothetical protein
MMVDDPNQTGTTMIFAPPACPLSEPETAVRTRHETVVCHLRHQVAAWFRRVVLCSAQSKPAITFLLVVRGSLPRVALIADQGDEAASDLELNDRSPLLFGDDLQELSIDRAHGNHQTTALAELVEKRGR